MLTTFARLAKILKGQTAPANWVESAFATILGKLLPTVTSSDKNKVLTVNNSGKWVAKAPSGGLPAVTASDEGKVLTVNSSGEWDAETPSGGGSILTVTESESDGYYVLDKTGNDIKNADLVKLAQTYTQDQEEFSYLTGYNYDARDERWYFNFTSFSGGEAFAITYFAETLDDYPSHSV